MFLIMVTTGRSGSTTLKNLVNSCPNAQMNGECWGALIDLLLFYKKMKMTNTMPNSLEWENGFCLQHLKRQIRSIIEDTWGGADSWRVFGFKDIRWFNRLDLLEILFEIYPDTMVWCHIRDPLEQSKSSWWASDTRSIYHLEEYNRQIVNFHKLHPDKSVLTHFDDIANGTKMIETFKKFKLDLTPQAFKRVTKHRSHRVEVHDKSQYCPYCLVGAPQDCYCQVGPLAWFSK